MMVKGGVGNRPSVYGDHGGPETVFLERGVLMGAATVVAFEEFQQFVAEHPIALAMDEDYAARLFLGCASRVFLTTPS